MPVCFKTAEKLGGSPVCVCGKQIAKNKIEWVENLKIKDQDTEKVCSVMKRRAHIHTATQANYLH